MLGLGGPGPTGASAPPHFPWVAYLVVAAVSASASALDLQVNYGRPPWDDPRGYGKAWLGIVTLDAGAGSIALWICATTHLQDKAQWLTAVLGWVVIGLAATLLVRANLVTLTIGKLSVPLGFGVIYGTLRSLIARPLWERLWVINDAESEGRTIWCLDRVDALGTQIRFPRVEQRLTSYLNQRDLREPDKGQRVRDATKAIAAARKVFDTNPAAEGEAVKQLVTFMLDKAYLPPLDRLLGSPNRNTVKGWRGEANLADSEQILKPDLPDTPSLANALTPPTGPGRRLAKPRRLP